MARTIRKQRKTSKTVRDGTVQYWAASCRHHGGCPYCESNRLFNYRKLNQDKLYKEDITNE